MKERIELVLVLVALIALMVGAEVQAQHAPQVPPSVLAMISTLE